MNRILTTALGVLALGSFTAMAQQGDGPPKDRQGPGAGSRRGAPPKEMLDKFDTNKNGKIDEGEERDALRADMEKRRKEAMAKYDKDGDGTLDEKERAAMMKDREAEMKKRYDKDGDGKLNAEEQADYDKAIERMKQMRGRRGGGEAGKGGGEAGKGGGEAGKGGPRRGPRGGGDAPKATE